MNAGSPPSGLATSLPQPLATPNPVSPPEPEGVFAAWPRSAQIALASLLVLAFGLLAWHASGMTRWGSRPTELEAAAFLRLDLNRADHVQLLQLPGVGENLSRRIEAYRTANHGFRTVDDLRNVSGIGPAVLERLRPFVYVEAYEDAEEDEPVAEPSYKPSPSMQKSPPAPAEKKATPTKKTDNLKERINVNEATAADLQKLPGVGPAMASHIIETRARQPFQTIDDLRHVKGIGVKTLENLRPYVTVEPSARIETNQ
jgi:competence ComEA-like helix-hairpin-helix protein